MPKTERCAKCDTTKDLTMDHIIPEWLTKRIELFDISIILIGNTQKLCKDHNTEKAGKIDYKDEKVREFMAAFVREIEKKLK
ncbi:hypothetical protein IH981_03760 [Patescibacteria group bacterium]|nr:hypothetical protein [Patescibacteria group bacterium]